MGLIFIIMNINGGGGKTTITGNLADALGDVIQQMLVVDMDGQCNTTSLFHPGHHPTRNTVRHRLARDEPVLKVPKCICPTPSANVFVLPNTPATGSVESQLLLSGPNSYFRLCRDHRDFDLQHFAFSLIETPPNKGPFVLSPLSVTDGVILPIKAGGAFGVEVPLGEALRSWFPPLDSDSLLALMPA